MRTNKNAELEITNNLEYEKATQTEEKLKAIFEDENFHSLITTQKICGDVTIQDVIWEQIELINVARTKYDYKRIDNFHK